MLPDRNANMAKQRKGTNQVRPLSLENNTVLKIVNSDNFADEVALVPNMEAPKFKDIGGRGS